MTNLDHVSTETLADYAEGLLRESDASAVAAHLEACDECHAEELLLMSLSEILAADNPGPMPAMYAARIDNALVKVAMSHPVSGSFHPESAPATPPALDLTPSVLAAAAAGGGGAGASNVVDLAERRRVVAQGLSRVTTVAASIVLLIGGTVLGLQAINGDGNGDVVPEIAAPAAKPKVTTQPSPARLFTNPAVKPDPKGKYNPEDESWTNRTGTVILKNGDAVLPGGQVKKAPKKKPAEPPADPAIVAGPSGPAASTRSVPSDNAPVIAANKQKPGKSATPAVTEDPAILSNAQDASGPEATDEPTDAAEGQTAAAAADSSGQQTEKSAVASDGNRGQAPYVEDSQSEYTDTNFAEKVLALVDKAGYRASSTGDPTVDPVETPTEAPSTQQFQATSTNASMETPSSADAVESPYVQGDAGPEVKARVQRCAAQLGGAAIAGDTGTWRGKPVTIVILPDPDPEDSDQVIARAISGPCSEDQPASSIQNLEHVQTVNLRRR